MQPESVGQNYNPLATEFSRYVQNARTEWTFGYPQVAAELGDLFGRRVLDFGCGGGVFSRFLADQGAQVTGIDVSASMIEFARKQHGESARFVSYQSADGLPNLGPVFDAAVANFVFCTFPSLEAVTARAREIRASLSEHGKLVLLHTNWDRANGCEFVSFKLNRAPELKTGSPISLVLKHGEGIRIDDFFFSQEDYRGALLHSGFARVDIKEIAPDPKALDLLDERRVSPFYLVVAAK